MLRTTIPAIIFTLFAGCAADQASTEPSTVAYDNIVKAPAGMASSTDDMRLTPDGRLVLK